MKLTIEDINNSVEGLVPNAKEIEIEDSSGNRLPIDKLTWTMEHNDGDRYSTAKLIIRVK